MIRGQIMSSSSVLVVNICILFLAVTLVNGAKDGQECSTSCDCEQGSCEGANSKAVPPKKGKCNAFGDCDYMNGNPVDQCGTGGSCFFVSNQPDFCQGGNIKTKAPTKAPGKKKKKEELWRSGQYGHGYIRVKKE